MSFRHGKDAAVYVDGIDLSRSLNSIGTSQSADTAETSVFQTSAKRYVAGLKDATISLGGFYSPGPGESFETLEPSLGGDVLISALPQGDGVGNVSLSATAIGTALTVNNDLGSAVGITLDGQSKQGLLLGRVISPLLERTVAGEGPSVDDGAFSDTNRGGVLVVHVTEITGAASVTVQTSADEATWTDAATIPVDEVGGYVAPIVGAVPRYVRATWTVGTSITFGASYRRS